MHDPPLVPIVTTHPVMQEGMEALLAMKYSVAGSADDAQEAVLLIREHEPDLVALDVNIPGGGGSAIVTTVRPDLPEVKYMVLSASASKEEVADMLKTGIDGYIMKTVEKSHFMRSVRMTLKGRKPISPEVASRLIEIDDDLRGLGRADTLTSHERHVMELVSRGYSYKEVAKTLSTRVRNVDSHIADIWLFRLEWGVRVV